MADRYAVISVSDKTGIADFAKSLVDRGYHILSTGGTAKFLESENIPYQAISQFTGQDEILGGRVKTLHPKVHAGILARRNFEADRLELDVNDFPLIDIVAVNLYPFVSNLKSADSKTLEDMVELIDIGGPTMLRASAKNFSSVYSVIDPLDYTRVISDIDADDMAGSLKLRKELAAKVFAKISSYDLAIAEYLSSDSSQSTSEAVSAPHYTGLVLERIQELRYGENPHQQAGWYGKVSTASSIVGENSSSIFQQLQGKELSYNNINDFSAALDVMVDLTSSNPEEHACVVVKHANPCGIAYGINSSEALRRALSSDPVSSFGGIISISHAVDEDVARILSDAFYEVVLAPEFSENALSHLSAKRNLRLIKVDYSALKVARNSSDIYRSIFSTFLVQTPDIKGAITSSPLDSAKWVSGTAFHNPEEEEDARLAWIAVKHVKSNAITIVKGGQLIGVGAGQMNRVDSVRLAMDRAKRYGFELEGSVLASDAFFPFPDSIDAIKGHGLGLIMQPGGSLKDREVIDAAKAAGLRMLLTGIRHFRH